MCKAGPLGTSTEVLPMTLAEASHPIDQLASHKFHSFASAVAIGIAEGILSAAMLSWRPVRMTETTRTGVQA